jgi:hypothetical protein
MVRSLTVLRGFAVLVLPGGGHDSDRAALNWHNLLIHTGRREIMKWLYLTSRDAHA